MTIVHQPMTPPYQAAMRGPFGLCRCVLPFFVFVLLSLALGSCSNEGDDGPFGDVDQLRQYRTALNPIIDEITAMEALVEERAVGSANVATAENLSAVYVEVRPRLLEALVDLDRLQPPRGTQQLHANIRQLAVLRLDAYALVLDGFSRGDTTRYPLAEQALRDANELILSINASLCELDVELDDRDNCSLLALRPRRSSIPDALHNALANGWPRHTGYDEMALLLEEVVSVWPTVTVRRSRAEA
ncbi:MAG: hypothetical protein VX733_13365 [Candidatus Latescibacterota bacterium]|nr:hypothetical protein [Candidatus Latescibacterota bacterium]